MDTTAELLLRFEGWTRRVPLGKTALVLGRSSDCDVPLPDPALSRRHCRIVPGEAGGWLVEDLGSRAGTFLGGVPLTGSTPLRPGEPLLMGSTQVRLQLQPSGPSVLSGDSERDTRNVQLLLQTVGDLHGTEDTAELLRTIVDRAIRIAGGERGALLLPGSGGVLEAAIARDAAGGDLPPEQALTRALPARALHSGRAVVLTDSEAPGSAATQSVLQGGLRSVLCAPLPGADGQAGVLYVDSSQPAEDFGPGDLAAFEALAAHSALALERARLREARERRLLEERQRLVTENADLRRRLASPPPIGESPVMRQALELVQRFARTDATVCLTGETGTGKEVIARHLHASSLRSSGPFVVIDCGAIPAGLIESELFGHAAGAFTGAGAARKGLFREANGGTVFLDEVGELPLELQTRLLRVLQERTVQPVGSAERVPIDVRVLCATHRDLRQRVAEGTFREDLYYRISVLTVPIPPLRERGGDVLLLARHFLQRFAADYVVGVTGFTREAAEALAAHPWPGNVRELEHCIQRAVLLATPPFVTRKDIGLGEEPDGAPGAPAERELAFPGLQEARAAATERFERAYLEEALQRAGGKMAEAAALAGVSRQLLRRLLRRHGIDRRHYIED
jgi:transcriptional regulator with GAF, ATPase, and Fis domain